MSPLDPEDESVPDGSGAAFHAPMDALREGLGHVRMSPADGGRVQLLVIRPGIDERAVSETVIADPAIGIAGDSWRVRPSSRTPDRSANPEAQVTIMNSRAALLFAATADRIPLAGDQVYLDLDLSLDNLPTGTRLDFGEAILEVTAAPHTGCAKFAARFGQDALRLTAIDEGRQLRLRGINARVVQAGPISVGDVVRVSRP
jgi:hypothetical protein